MHRDPTLRKRNALVIPGVLLVLVSLVGILYAQMLRSDRVTCDDGTLVFVLDACRSAALLLAIPLVIGIVLIALGAFMRRQGTCHLGHGTTATTILAVLVAAMVLPALASLALMAMEDPDSPYVLTSGDVDYGLPRLLGGAAILGFLLLLPYLVLYIATARPPACCRAKACFEPCYCDEGDGQAALAAPPIPAFPAPEPQPQETAQVTTAPWPPKREAHPLVPISAPIVPEEQAPQQLDAPIEDAPMAPDTWPAPPPEPVNDPWAAKPRANDPFATPPTEAGVWTPPPPEAEEESESLRARGSAAKAKPKTAATKAGAAAATKEKAAAKGAKAPAKKSTRKVTTKKKTE